MRLSHGLHLGYCTNIHRGETWAETFEALQRYTLAVRDQLPPIGPYGIGLRLGAEAARSLAEPKTLKTFQGWLDRENCYVFTINGFPYGRFHGVRVKEQVYAPDWTTPERLAYTNQLFDLLAELLPSGMSGSVSTVPVSFKAFNLTPDQLRETRANLWRCLEHIEQVSERSGRDLHLGLEPEPLCTLETTEETIRYFEALRTMHPEDSRIGRFLGVNYDCCHLAVEFEEPRNALKRLQEAGIRLSKIHLSSALKLQPTLQARAALQAFADDTYLHQVIARRADGTQQRWLDLPDALQGDAGQTGAEADEWRIHFHIPLHAQPAPWFATTTDHLLAVLDEVQRNPALCQHFEMETYTWDVMPAGLKDRNVVDQLIAEYGWTLAQFAERGFHRT